MPVRLPARRGHAVEIGELSGGETILLLVDDEEIRRSARFMLEAEGYAVLAADGDWPEGAEAGRWHCIVVDSELPGPRGNLPGEAGCPVVRLVNHAETPGPDRGRQVEKPMLGAALAMTVEGALRGGRLAPT